MYLPKVWRTFSLCRSCSIMRLKASDSCPISSCVVMVIERVEMAGPRPWRVPSSSNRTGRVMPPLTSIAKIRPTIAASTVTTPETTMVFF